MTEKSLNHFSLFWKILIIISKLQPQWSFAWLSIKSELMLHFSLFTKSILMPNHNFSSNDIGSILLMIVSTIARFIFWYEIINGRKGGGTWPQNDKLQWHKRFVLTSKETSGCSLSPVKNSMLIVMMPWLKSRTCKNIASFCDKTYRWPSEVLVSKIGLSCGKNSNRPCSNDCITSFCPVLSLIRLASIAKSNRTVSADIVTFAREIIFLFHHRNSDFRQKHQGKAIYNYSEQSSVIDENLLFKLKRRIRKDNKQSKIQRNRIFRQTDWQFEHANTSLPAKSRQIYLCDKLK